jgi:hypothetical protein
MVAALLSGGIEAGIVDEAALTEADMDRPLSRYRRR